MKKRILKKFEQFEPEAEVQVQVDVERLQKLIDMALPLFTEISAIISQEEDRTISFEYREKIETSIDSLHELKSIYKK